MRKINRPPCPNIKALKKSYKNKENKNTLIKASHGKCMYCEAKIEHTQYGDIEHIKPKSKYPDLTFNWHNLGFSCSICNNNKKDKDDDLINPYIDSPENHIKGVSFMIIDKTSKGYNTINIVGLNRESLNESRIEKIKEINTLIEVYLSIELESQKEKIFQHIKDKTNEDKEFSFIILEHLRLIKLV